MSKTFSYTIYVLLTITITIASSCKPSSKVTDKDTQVILTERPDEKYEEEKYEPKTSIVNIPIKIELKALQKSINENITGLIFEDNSYDDNGGDNVKMKVWKKGTITLKADSDAFEYYVPLRLWVKVKYGVLGVNNYQEVKGSIALTFRTNYEIDKTWDLITATTLKDYKWLEKPKINVLGMNISIQGIANNLLKSNKAFLEKSIDDQIKENLNIQQSAQDAWAMLQDPIKVNEDFNVWLKLTPESVVMTPLKSNQWLISGTIGIKSTAEVVISEQKPQVNKNTKLPPFSRPTSIADSFAISIASELPFKEAEKIVQKQLVGQTFSQGKRSITIQEIQLYGQNDLMVIDAFVDGSIKGNIYMVGKPVFDVETNTVKIDDVDFDVKTRNVLVRSAEWLFHSTILKKIEPYLSFPLENNINDAKKMIQDQLNNYEPVKGIVVNGTLKDLRIDGIQMTPRSIRVTVSTTGKMKLDVNGLSF